MWAQPRPLHPIRDDLEWLLCIEPVLIIVALIMLFAPTSTRWFDHERRIKIEAIQ